MKVRKTIVGSQIGVKPPGGEDRRHPSPTSLSTCLEVSERLKSFSRPRLHSLQASALTLPLLSHANMLLHLPAAQLRYDIKKVTTELQHHPVWERGVIIGPSCLRSAESGGLQGGNQMLRSPRHLIPWWLHWAGKVSRVFFTTTVCRTNARSRTVLHLFCNKKTLDWKQHRKNCKYV